MGEIDFFIIFAKALTLAIYGTIIFLGFIFTFYIETYRRIDELLGMSFLSNKIISPILETNINYIDEWFIAHNKIIGPLLILLSFIDIATLFKIIDLL